MAPDKVNLFLNDFTQWASAQSDIQALALVGSHARNAATETSDVDLVLITIEPDRYLHNSNWVQRFGTIEKQQVEDYGLLTSIRVWYLDGLEIEYGITDERWSAVPLDAGTQEVMSSGMRVLFERGTILSRHRSPP
ncbi:MAG: aminoglycoside 6-adenylyltransferase [Caldilinea sp.]